MYARLAVARSLYGVAGEKQRAEVLALARQSSAPDWWRKYSDILPGWFETYLGLESAASTIRFIEQAARET